MPIKQIQLRGISRTPSDRATADGGLAEALNVHLDQQETAPTLPPEDISDDIYSDNTRYEILYIHKMPGGITNYIGHYVATSRPLHGLYAYGDTISQHLILSELLTEERITHLTSIGNTLIAYTDKSPYYFLFKNGDYLFLGKEIPRPQIEFITRPSDSNTRTFLFDITEGMRDTNDVDVWNNAIASGDSRNEALLEEIRTFWEEVSLKIQERRVDNIFVAPFFIRYALQLYDNRYIYLSSPILCGAGAAAWISAQVSETYYDETGIVDYHGYRMNVVFENCFKVRALMNRYNLSNWSDLVISIDFFASTPLYTPAIESHLEEVVSGRRLVFEGMADNELDNTVENALLSKSQFYLIKSIDVQSQENLSDLYAGDYKIEASEWINGDLLPTQKVLQDSYRDGAQYLPVSGCSTLNKRALLAGADEVLPRGEAFLNGLVSSLVGESTKNVYRYMLRFKIVDPNTGASKYVIPRYKNGSTLLIPGVIYENDGDDDNTIQHFGDDTATADLYFPATPHSWLTYPDTRCKQVEVFFYDLNGNFQRGKLIPMKPHPYLQCSYAFWGMGIPLRSVIAMREYETVPLSEQEDRVLSSPNKLFLSEFENPFLFPSGNIITFPDKVIGAAMTSAPLSEGQVGDFDLYVFTEGGIRVLSVNSEGTFSGNNVMPTNVSRHVALPGTITPIEQAIIFTTEKGVMLLSGSQVTELSRFMNGRPYALEEDARALIQRSQWAPIVDAIGGGEPFMAFMRNAKAAYDSNGARLIFFNPDRMYQYVYMMETQTWHKILTGVTSPKILNSYPDCLVSFGQHILNFSTVLDDAELLSDTDNPVYGVIITRPFDLGEPDIRKTITNVRIRGNFNRKDVQYILLGSFDDIHWQRLHSLRGGSYKLFRMIIACRLTAAERITWVDVEYESRFTNKLR